MSNLVANEKKRERQFIEQGIRLEKTETAKAFLSMGFTPEQVAEGTRLTTEDVNRIMKEMAH